METALIMKFYQKNVSRVKHGNIKKQLTLWVTMIGKHSMCVQSITQEVQELWKLSACRKCLVDLSTSMVYDIPFTLEMVTPNHLTRFVNLTPTLATPLQKENVLVMSKKRVGSRLRNVKSQYKGKKLSDSKGIGGGKGRLTNKVMNAHPKLIWNVNSPKHS